MSSLPVPPSFVPTLTEVVDRESEAVESGASAIGGMSVSACDVEAAAVQRALRHVDLILESRLQEAVGKLVLAQSQTLALQLREEVAQVVQQCMSQAFKAAVRANPGPETNPCSMES